jgi:hypothetical protein
VRATEREAPDLRAGGLGGTMPLEFRGASGALDTEHKDRNLPPYGSHIRFSTYPATCSRMPTLTDEQRCALRAED